MLSFENQNGNNKPLAIINGGKLNNKIIYLDEDINNKKQYVSYELLNNKLNTEISIKDGKLFPLPELDKRECIFISGPAGSGKSTYVAEYIDYYKSIHSRNDIYLFSKINDDKAFKKYEKKIIKIPLDESLMSEPIESEDVKNSLVIFDDVDTITDKKLQEFIDKLRDDLLECGRHQNIYILNTGHNLLNWKKTKVVLNESTGVVFFPRSGAAHAIKGFLTKYCGLDREQVAKIFHLDSRWVYINKSYPLYVVSEHKIYLI